MPTEPHGGSERTLSASLVRLGWDERRQAELDALGLHNVMPGRIAAQHKGGYRVSTADAELLAVARARVLEEVGGTGNLAVGDWVVLDAHEHDGRAAIVHVLERRTKFSRHSPRAIHEEQVIAVNVDVVFVVTAVPHDFNVRRLERYATLVAESGARPVVVINKVDLAGSGDAFIAEARKVLATDVPIVATSAHTGLGLTDLWAHVRPGETVVLLGSSGVGKSSLVNTLMGDSVRAVKEVRASDDRGKHATTAREMWMTPSGALVIDTPGLRGVQLWASEESLDEAFPDIVELARSCRFSDCQHADQPGCAVRAAVEKGTLGPDRLASYERLAAELAIGAEATSTRAARRRKR